MSKSKQNDNNSDANVSMSRTRVKPMGRTDTIQMEDIPLEQQHLYLQIGKRLYHKAGLSPEQLRKFDTPTVGTDGAPACAIQPFSIGGNVRVISDNVPASES
ncbi:hypothetical protein H6G17_26145 [Chroococcidiopsis sp. FACHB-1243]|uniref:hypothetical protein n=1 Tax=Chroococcidiopsis sp. [FACHB-1243] TaxID=2692781 RepID=UPI0017812444|nr:hypothetical protein [Chroococcidiopsis sp. [FACHB-1243]]MBD2308953.1 hypothetical protein [Chroococcidiopsis sp. [FACHB-1243]]